MSAQGITPAHAGKSQLVKAFQRRSWDHPRVCGEKLIGRLARLDGLGSPPRMRGKVFEQVYTRIPFRITPAYAGKRCSARTPTFRTWDHPRMCGEKFSNASVVWSLTGSPPRVRGKEERRKARATGLRITPAYAGKSSIQHLTASLGEFEVQKGHPVPHLRQCLQVWPDHARHLRHGLILHASRSAGQGRRLCPGPYPDTAGSGTPRGPSPAKRPHTSPPAATPVGCRAWQSGATAPGSR